MSTESQSPDDLDRMFGTYLQAQLPKRWPDAPLTAEPLQVATTDTTGRSRLTLAVCVVTLLGFGLLLSGGSKPLPGRSVSGSKESLLPSSTADGTKVFKSPSTKN